VILRENQQYLTLKGIEECKLIISMLAMVVHKVPSEDLVCLPLKVVFHRLTSQRSSGGFGGYHLAVLAIAARFFDSQTWADITIPANEVSSSQSSLRSDVSMLIHVSRRSGGRS
jgi:nuclear pore complex protein Nup205